MCATSFVLIQPDSRYRVFGSTGTVCVQETSLSAGETVRALATPACLTSVTRENVEVGWNACVDQTEGMVPVARSKPGFARRFSPAGVPNRNSARWLVPSVSRSSKRWQVPPHAFAVVHVNA